MNCGHSPSMGAEELERKIKSLRSTVASLKGKSKFAEARKELESALKTLSKGTDDYIWAQQQRALCTYKDTQLRPDYRFKNALDILNSIGLHESETDDPETLGLGGAVYKRMWEQDGNEAYLRAALELYRAGWTQNPLKDNGYCGVNAAYLLDLSACLAERLANHLGIDKVKAKQLRYEAECLRKDMLAQIPVPRTDEKNYWIFVTFAEIHFGLDEFSEAKTYLEQARQHEGRTWKFETTASQLLNLARWRGYIVSTADGIRFVDESEKTLACRAALAALLGDDLDAALGRLRGKVGLALSGGGFRAAFYHLGVLARLAEIDALRHVEVLSTVSGGSIVGAHYYLELKQLLEVKPDDSISREDYIAIVRRVQEHFFKGVQKNLRMRILSSLRSNVKMLFTSSYTRSHRIGELYEQEIYSKVADGNSSCTPRTMLSLLLRPHGVEEKKEFKPRQKNWLRCAKVPELVVNTTSLNSGHNFQFTASWMGEPPGLTGAEVDMNLRHRRLYYSEAPKDDLREFRLGYAVAASSCVPGLFDPLEIDGLYPGRIVRLVDGGVHDNQGVAGLLDEGCDFILCSDASGQMHDDANPSSTFVGVPLRSNDILQDRIRECEYEHLHAMSLSGRLKGLFFIHLKKDLAQEDIGWVGGPEKMPIPQPNQTPYGIDRDIQRRLAEIRTDLDSFSQVEAYSLMLSGYCMAEEHAKALDKDYRDHGGRGTWGGFFVDAPREEWSFLKLAPIAAKPCDSSDLRRKDLEKQLAVGKEMMFKAWMLSPSLRAIKYLLGALVLVAVAAFVCWSWRHRDSPFQFCVSHWEIVVSTGIFLITAVLAPCIAFLPQSSWRKFLLKLYLAVGGWVVANVHLGIFDRIFLKRGRVERLLRLAAEE